MTIRKLSDGSFVVHYPCDLRMINERKSFVKLDGMGRPKNPEEVPIIVKLGRAYRMSELMLSGTYKSRQEVADALGGLGLLIGSSHLLVWGAVDFAKFCGVSDLVIGLTIVAAGTSLPELASAVASARRGEHEFVLGNIIGSNLFNTLAVVGLATVISPLVPGPNGEPAFSHYILTRDIPLMTVLSLTILFFGINWKHPKWPGAIQRKEAWIWIVTFVAYTLLMFYQETH